MKSLTENHNDFVTLLVLDSLLPFYDYREQNVFHKLLVALELPNARTMNERILGQKIKAKINSAIVLEQDVQSDENLQKICELCLALQSDAQLDLLVLANF